MRSFVLTHFLVSTFLLSLCQRPVFATPKIYIVYLGSHHNGEYDLFSDPESVTKTHHNMLSSVLSDVEPAKKLIYSYNKVFNGFAASLHEEEAEELRKHPDVISIFENQHGSPQTTRSWEFLGLKEPGGNKDTLQNRKTKAPGDESIWKKARFGEDFIVGCLDSGIWPESKSFSDEGYGPIPKKFKGQCQNGNDPTFKCNRKLIGARQFREGFEYALKLHNLTSKETVSPRDPYSALAHGTHVLSIAAGNFVPKMDSILTPGTVKGGLPRARVAMYKVCWTTPNPQLVGQCNGADVLAAYEAAIADGVDIINFSVGLGGTGSFFNDALVIGGYHAMAHDILAVAGAGNTGPTPGTVSNLAPWILTVGSGSIDRDFQNEVILGNKKHILGGSQTWANNTNIPYPLVLATDVRLPAANITHASQCMIGTIDPMKVKGKIVVCDQDDNHGAGKIDYNIADTSAGIIFANKKVRGFATTLEADSFLASRISYHDSQTLFAYINSTRSPVASITAPVTKLGTKPAPYVSVTSSRGPNLLAFDILKPDITAPGRQIFAAYLSKYKVVGGTSMACPHVTGIAGLVKIMHPTWSTSAIKSAIMTTASPLDNTGKRILEEDLTSEATPFGYGSGHVQPIMAMDPGLVYDMDHIDHLNYLCSQPDFNQTLISRFTTEAFKCNNSKDYLHSYNYPSISVRDFTGTATVTRKLKNVGQPGKYSARVEALIGISIVVEPKTLMFSSQGQVIEYKMSLTSGVGKLSTTDYTFGSLVWSDGKHSVRSPIVVIPKGKIERDFARAP